MNIEKIEKILTPIIVILIVIGGIIYIVVTGYNKSIKEAGIKNVSKYDDYKSMLEFSIENGPHFAIVLDSNYKVLSTLCFNDESVIISKEKTNNKNYKKSLKIILDKLYNSEKIGSKIVVTNYDYNLVGDTTEVLKDYFINHNLDVKIETNKSKLKRRTKASNIPFMSYKRILIVLNISSAETIKDYNTRFSYKEYKKYATEVYKNLEKYKNTNNIINQDISDSKLNITEIPGSDDIYPDSDSWYYIKDNRIYAYIKFSHENKKYNFCYNGSRENVSEGSCQNEE